jgi:hypothetical protein
MAERSEASSVLDHSNTEIARSNPARSTDVCVYLFCVELCVDSGLAWG